MANASAFWCPTIYVCLYVGKAKSLFQRISEWRSEQKLTIGALSSRTLSSFCLTLLALNDFDYRAGRVEIDTFMDALDVCWQTTAALVDAEAIETAELRGEFRYPLNDLKNRHHPELNQYIRHLRTIRKNYRQKYLSVQR